MKTLAALALALFLVPSHAPPASAAELNACVKRSGSMNLIGPNYRRQACTPSQTPLTLNTEGPQGDVGPAGPQGPTGPAGPPAPQGAGNIAFATFTDAERDGLPFSVLTTDGLIFSLYGTDWVQLDDSPGTYNENLTPPLPVSQIAEWKVAWLLATDGNIWLWVRATHTWSSFGHP